MNIRMSKSKLLETLRKNRAAHRTIFEEALKGFKQRYNDLWERCLADARAAGKLTAGPIPPKDHTEDYDRIIKILELDNCQEVELSEVDVQRYFMDDWAWKRDFLESSYSFYSTSAVKALKELPQAERMRYWNDKRRLYP
jgi:hypothetical protein